MSIPLERLIKKASMPDLKLAAGSGGLQNDVTWVHIAETPEAAQFLEGGEITLVTGVGISESKPVRALVETIAARNASGIIINIGPFIENIPPDVLAFCDARALPLFTVPWRTHLEEIMHIFCLCLSREDQRHQELSAALKNAIFFPKEEELYAVPLSRYSFRTEDRYAVCALQIDRIRGDADTRMIALADRMETWLQHRFSKFTVFPHDDKILAVTDEYSDAQVREFSASLCDFTQSQLLAGETFSVGVGKLTKSIRCLCKSYRQANAIIKLQQKGKISKELYYYQDMGVYRLLLGVEDNDILNDYFEQTLGKLVAYDEANGTDLTDVLRCYLKNNGSIKAVSEQLFLHRNTVNYKLTRASEILGIDLSSLDDRLELDLCYKLIDMR